MGIRTTFIDMDGVLVDWFGGACKVFGIDRSEAWERLEHGSHDLMHDVFKMSKAEFWQRIVAEGESFWHNLELLPWAEELIKLAQANGEICILTSPSQNPKCMDGKRMWLWDHFGRDFRSYFFGPDKFHGSRPGALLIDDHEHNIDAFICDTRGGSGLLVPQPWNRNFEHFSEDGSWVLNNMKAAYDV